MKKQKKFSVMVFCALVFFIEISVKKNFNRLLEQLYMKVVLRFRVFETETTAKKKTRNYQIKMPTNPFLACFHIMSKKIEKMEFSKKSFQEIFVKNFR